MAEQYRVIFREQLGPSDPSLKILLPEDTVKAASSFTAQSWLGHPVSNSVIHDLRNRPKRVAWLSTKAFPESPWLKQDLVQAMRHRKELQKEDKLELIAPSPVTEWVSKTEEGFRNGDRMLRTHYFLINDSKRIYIDMQIFYERNCIREGQHAWQCINPLPLLTIVGPMAATYNGLGKEDVGSWAYDVIRVSIERPTAPYLCETNYFFGINPPPKMRIMTNEEWDRMCDLVAGYDARIHWDTMYSWVEDKEKRYHMPTSARALRGYTTARNWSYYSASTRIPYLGFRPVVESMDASTLPPDSKDGDHVVIGTLYMNGIPVRVPQAPLVNGDIEDYIPGTTLEMRKPLDDPDYQVTGILDGGKAYCDRNLLKNISYEDIEKAIV